MNYDQQAILAILAEMGISCTEMTLFHIVGYGSVDTVDSLPRRGKGSNYSPGPSNSLEECQAALNSCLSKGWLQVINEISLSAIAEDINEHQLIGPIYGMPRVNNVDFTTRGVQLFQDYLARQGLGESRTSFVFIDVVYEKVAYYYPSEKSAMADLERIRKEDVDIVSINGPVCIGPWRLQWWRRFREGYRVDIERRRKWTGRCGSGDSIIMHRSDRWRANPNQLQSILQNHNVTYREWLLFATIENGINPHPVAMQYILKCAEKQFGIPAINEDCKADLQACIDNGWIRNVDDNHYSEIKAILDNDNSITPLSASIERKSNRNSYDFTPAGAALYRLISETYVGPDWEDDLHVTKELFREEHRYCATKEGIESAIRELDEKHENIQASCTVAIGPWCVYWWDCYPSGYRLEVEISNPQTL